MESLPATLLDGQLVMAGKLPSREDIARWAGISLTQDWNEDSTQPRCCSIPPYALIPEELNNDDAIFTEYPPRLSSFTGKGGVGKTSLACATAVWLADQGRRTLLVSTDPASNVGQVFSQTVGHRITGIRP